MMPLQRRQRFLRRQTAPQSVLNDLGIKPQNLGPIWHRECLAIERDHPSISFIPLLATSSSPPAIYGLIVSAWINSIQCPAGRAFAHIRAKSLEAFLPLWAHLHSSAAVLVIIASLRAIAAAFHIQPRLISAGSFPRSRLSMRCSPKWVEAADQAPAGLDVISFQAMATNNLLASTVAKAKPLASAASQSSIFEHTQVIKFKPYKTQKLRWHAITIGLFSLFLTACTHQNQITNATLPPQIITKTVFLYPSAPQAFLECDPEPLAPDATTDSELAQWAESVRLAGGDCRAKIDSLRAWVAGWPK